MFMRIAVGRKERELDPAIAALRACAAEAQSDPAVHAVANERLKALLGFVETLDRWYVQMLGVPKQKLAALIRLGTRIVGFLPGGRKT
jgi:hypothetical protein